MSGNLAEWVSNLDSEHLGNAFVGGGYYKCFLCTPSGYCHDCTEGSDNDEFGVYNMSDCYPGSQSQAQMWESFDRTWAMELLGVRCCLDIP